MGVTITVRPGTVDSPRGETLRLTTDDTGRIATALRAAFGSSPIELCHRDARRLRLLSLGALPYVKVTLNLWEWVLHVIDEYGDATITVEYGQGDGA